MSPFGNLTVVLAMVSPSSATLYPGDSRQFTAVVQLSDGSQPNVPVDWTATGGVIDRFGDFTADPVPGSFVVVATEPNSGVADTAQITIRPTPTLTSVAVSPSPVSIAPGQGRQFSATGVRSDGSTVPVSPNWTTNDPQGIVTSSGRYTAGQTTGQYLVTATDAASGLAGSAQVTVNASSATLTSITVSPKQVSVTTGNSRRFTAVGRLSDGSTTSVSVTWSTTDPGGTLNTSGLYTAGQTLGTYDVVALESGAGFADTAKVTVSAPLPPGSFPQGYRVDRALLQNNPGALIAGDDWLFATQTSDIRGYGFEVGLNPSVEATTLSVPYNPGATRAEVITDQTFVHFVRMWQTDASDQQGWSVRFKNPAFNNTVGKNRIWYRVVMKFQSGFTNQGVRGDSAWKVFFGAHARLIGYSNGVTYSLGGHFPYGSNYSLLPNSPPSGVGGWGQIGQDGSDEFNDEEWYEWVMYEEPLSPTSYRFRIWMRRITTNGVLDTGLPWLDKTGWIGTGLNVTGYPNSGSFTEMFITRNSELPGGNAQWWGVGPYEVIDGDVLPDPYGLANDML